MRNKATHEPSLLAIDRRHRLAIELFGIIEAAFGAQVEHDEYLRHRRIRRSANATPREQEITVQRAYAARIEKPGVGKSPAGIRPPRRCPVRYADAIAVSCVSDAISSSLISHGDALADDALYDAQAPMRCRCRAELRSYAAGDIFAQLGDDGHRADNT